MRFAYHGLFEMINCRSLIWFSNFHPTVQQVHRVVVVVKKFDENFEKKELA